MSKVVEQIDSGAITVGEVLVSLGRTGAVGARVDERHHVVVKVFVCLDVVLQVLDQVKSYISADR